MIPWASVEDDKKFAEPDNSSQAGQANSYANRNSEFSLGTGRGRREVRRKLAQIHENPNVRVEVPGIEQIDSVQASRFNSALSAISQRH